MIGKTPAEVATYFSMNPAKYAGSYEEVTAEGYSFRVRKERLLELLGRGPGKVLDIGCGPAVMSQEIADAGFSYDGTDISEAMIAEAKKIFPSGSFSVGVVEHINASDKTYDAVVAMGLVEYVESDEVAIREMRRVLNEKGVLLVSLPNWWSPMRMWDRYIIVPLASLIHSLTGKSKPHVFHREYREGAYKKLIEKNGFVVEKVMYYNFRLLPRPLDYWLPSLSVWTATILEGLRFTPLKFWATGFIVKARRS